MRNYLITGVAVHYTQYITLSKSLVTLNFLIGTEEFYWWATQAGTVGMRTLLKEKHGNSLRCNVLWEVGLVRTMTFNGIRSPAPAAT